MIYFYDIEKLLHPYMKTTLEKGGKEMSKKECRKLVCVLALSLLMAMPGNGIAQMASASNSITTLSVEKNEQDVAVLQKIIATQSGKNTTISENLNDSKQYTWENGRLVGINWSDENNIYTGGRGMTGAISFAGLSALKQLNCSGNSITALDVSGNTALETLECFNTSITALDLSNNVLLKDLQCGYANLKELHVENNPALENLSCEGTYIYKLDVSKNKALKTLRCNNTGLTSLDLSQNAALESLICYYTKIQSLDVSHNAALEILSCLDNSLTGLDVSSNLKLKELYCSKTDISNLDVSKNTLLEVLYCDNTKISSLDLSKNKKMRTLRCDDSVQVTGFRPQPTQTPDVAPSAAPDNKPSQRPAGIKPLDTAIYLHPTATPKATAKPTAAGTKLKNKNASYQVVSANPKQPTVTYVQNLKKTAASVTVPAQVKIGSVTYKVVAIGSKAFANNKKLKTLTIGKNITTIGKNAFAGCKKLKKITIKSTKLKSGAIGKNAFKGTAKNLVVKVPRKQYRAYKKFLKKKGNKKVKIKK